MKKFTIILFLSSYLFSTTHSNELLKINSLVEHYIEHTNNDKNLTLWSFLSMHYSQSTIIDADYEKDMKLPFKSLHTCNHTSINFCTPIQEFDFIKKNLVELYKSPLFNYNFSFSYNFHSSIWQPPKSC